MIVRKCDCAWFWDDLVLVALFLASSVLQPQRNGLDSIMPDRTESWLLVMVPKV